MVLNGTVVGTINLDVDQAHSIAMLGFAISRAHWGKGIGSEAVRTAVAWGFDAFGLAKIWATTDARNARSQRLMEKLGMQLEGQLRSHERARDGRTDKLCYGLLRVEWQELSRKSFQMRRHGREHRLRPSSRPQNARMDWMS